MKAQGVLSPLEQGVLRFFARQRGAGREWFCYRFNRSRFWRGGMVLRVLREKGYIETRRHKYFGPEHRLTEKGLLALVRDTEIRALRSVEK